MLKNMYKKIRSNKFLKDVFGIGIFRVGGIITNFMLVGVIYRYFSNDELNGIWLTIFSTLSWITLLDFGMANGLRNKLTEMITNKNYSSARKYISTTYVIMSAPIILMFIIVSLVAKYINWISLFNVKYENIGNQYLSFFIIIIFGLYSVNFYLSIIYAIMHSVFKSYIVTMIQFVTNVVNIILIVLITFWNINDLIVLCSVYIGSSIIILFLFTHLIFNIKYKELKPSIKYFDKSVIKEIVGIGSKFLVLQIAIILLFTTDNLIISKFLGVAEVTPYQLSNKLLGICQIILGIILVPLWSHIIKLKTNNNTKEIKETIKKIIIVFIILALVTVVLGFLSRKIIKVWVGESIFISVKMIICMVIYNILHMWCNIFQSILNGLNKLNGQVIVYIIATIINIPISIIFVKNTQLGSAGVILGTIVSLSIVAICIPIIAIKELKSNE